MHPFMNPRLDQCDAFALIQAERAYQDAKWGSIAEHPHEVGAWLLVMKGKLDAAISSWQSTAGTDIPALIHLVKALAVGVACLEQHGGPVVAKAISDMEFTKTNHGYLSPNQRSKCYWPMLESIRARIKEQAKNPLESSIRLGMLVEIDRIKAIDTTDAASWYTRKQKTGFGWIDFSIGKFTIGPGLEGERFVRSCGDGIYVILKHTELTGSRTDNATPEAR